MTLPTKSAHRVRGQPLLVLVAVLGGWLGLRFVLWQSPFPGVADRRAVAAIRQQEGPADGGGMPLESSFGTGSMRVGDPRSPAMPDPSVSLPRDPPTARRTAGQQLLLSAGVSQVEFQPVIAALPPAPEHAGATSSAVGLIAPPAGTPAPPRPSNANRWSGDGWLLLRRDSTGVATAGVPSYGRSQAGAVLRYRLAMWGGHRPVAYGRASRSLSGPAESEIAVGLAARPLAGVPLTVAGEVRAYQGFGRRELRPAAYAVTELPPARLPLGLRGEAYVQAGYVGGKFATAFVDGQAHVDVQVARLGTWSALRAGAGVWGGAQKHASRLDVGPSATMSFQLGPTRSRLALDYRWRVAGNAEPSSGPALTISAGF
jgi:hypothetical protein